MVNWEFFIKNRSGFKGHTLHASRRHSDLIGIDCDRSSFRYFFVPHMSLISVTPYWGWLKSTFLGDWALTIGKDLYRMVNQQIWTNYRTFGCVLHFNYQFMLSFLAAAASRTKILWRGGWQLCRRVKTWWLRKNFFPSALIHAHHADISMLWCQLKILMMWAIKKFSQISRVTIFNFKTTNFRNSIFILLSWCQQECFFCAFSFNKMKIFFSAACSAVEWDGWWQKTNRKHCV